VTDIMVKKKSKTVLEMGAEISAKEGDIQPMVPWWKDPQKLVDAALNNDPDRRKVLLAALTDCASRDDDFRRDMLSEFRRLGAGKRASPGRPFFEKVMLVDLVEFFQEHLKRKNKPHTITDVCIYIADRPAWFGSIGSGTIQNLYYELKDDPAIRECINTLA
jgi:hypothetical protein